MKTSQWSFWHWVLDKVFKWHTWENSGYIKATQPKNLVTATVMKCPYCQAEKILIPGFNEVQPNVFAKV